MISSFPQFCRQIKKCLIINKYFAESVQRICAQVLFSQLFYHKNYKHHSTQWFFDKISLDDSKLKKLLKNSLISASNEKKTSKYIFCRFGSNWA